MPEKDKLNGPDWGIDPDEGVFTAASDPQTAISTANEAGDYHQFWAALVAAIRDGGPNPRSSA